MIINLIKTSRLFSLTLPKKIKGQYWLSDIDEKGLPRKLISVEARDENWVVRSSDAVGIYDQQGRSMPESVLSNGTFLNVKINGSTEKAVLFTEQIDASRQTLTKIMISGPDNFSIGRSDSNNFCYANPYVSGEHARLYFDGEGWSVQDNDSTNGTYVNGFRVRTRNVEPGDSIYIMGLKIVIGDRYIAVNNPDFRLKIRANSLKVYSPVPIAHREPDTRQREKSFFSRSPRFYREVEHEDVTIDPPPQPEKADTVPLALMLGPSITMGMTSVSTGMLTLTNVISNGGQIRQAMPTLVMSVSMLLGTILWPILTKRYEKKQKILNEKKRQKKYLSYLNDVSDEIKRIGKTQSEILNANLVTQEECVDRIARVKPNLWERVNGNSDFLKLRLGVGTLPMDVEVKYQEKKFTMEDDTLQNAMLSLAEEPKVLYGVPVSFELDKCIAAGIYGEKVPVENMLKALIMQMISLHSYDELKLMLITDAADADNWAFVKYVPHFWTNDKKTRFFAASQDETKELSAYIENVILSRAADENNQKKSFSPYYVIISTSDNLAKKCEGIRNILDCGENLGCSVLLTNDKVSGFPKETSKVIYANGEDSRLSDKDDTTGSYISFTADRANEVVFENIGARIANIELDVSDQSYSLPNMLTFLDMFSVSKVEHLNSLTRWKENNPTKTLQTPIGVDTFGDTFKLDLHEKFHGPHGLVAGMTGSGKSEFLITYILSLAVNYHPDEVSFILIDYKGGGLAGAFEDKDKGIKLPHLAGVITNLDGAAINRTLVSFQSERRRREAILNKARKIANEGTMDIYKYQQLYRDKIVTEPLPHLIIIADEFAELKAQQPDFMEQLISLARVGRSLGIHLILATQKPSGVVDDQIWSNSKFRVCLKVQEKADSQEMIKRPDAAELAQTGRFYLQVGFNELFALGQSAWCGAEYIPSDTIKKPIDTSIQVIDNLGRTIMNVKPAKSSGSKKNTTKQIVAIVNYLSGLADEENISVRSLWLDPIPALIYVDALEKKYNHTEKRFVLDPVVGEYDDPSNQRQDILTVPFSREGNCLIYGSPGNGKEAFLTTLCYSLLKSHSAEELNLYIMDFGAETLKVFEKAPQVGGVIVAAEQEKVINLFKMLKKEIETRKALFSEFGGDFAGYCKSGHSDVPNIVVVLNNFSAFTELYEDSQDDFTLLSRDGVNYGVYFVASASGTNAVRYRTQQNFKLMMTTQLNDPTDYTIVLGKTNGIVPSKFKGRGLTAIDKVYEFQTACCAEVDDQQEFLRKFCAELASKASVQARPVPMLPNVVDHSFISPYSGSISSIPVGVSKASLGIANFNLAQNVLYPVLSQDIADAVSFTDVLIKVVSDSCGDVTVFDPDKLLPETTKVTPSSEYEEQVKDIYEQMVLRNNTYKDAALDVASLEGFEEKTIVILGIKKFTDMLGRDANDKFLTLIDKAQSFYKIHFIAVDSLSQFNSLCFDSRVKGSFTGAEGIWIGDGIADQYVLKLNKVTSDLYDELEKDYGYIVSRNRPRLIKLLSNGEE